MRQERVCRNRSERSAPFPTTQPYPKASSTAFHLDCTTLLRRKDAAHRYSFHTLNSGELENPKVGCPLDHSLVLPAPRHRPQTATDALYFWPGLDLRLVARWQTTRVRLRQQFVRWCAVFELLVSRAGSLTSTFRFAGFGPGCRDDLIARIKGDKMLTTFQGRKR